MLTQIDGVTWHHKAMMNYRNSSCRLMWFIYPNLLLLYWHWDTLNSLKPGDVWKHRWAGSSSIPGSSSIRVITRCQTLGFNWLRKWLVAHTWTNIILSVNCNDLQWNLNHTINFFFINKMHLKVLSWKIWAIFSGPNVFWDMSKLTSVTKQTKNMKNKHNCSSLQNKCRTADPDRQNLGVPSKLSFFIIQ